MAIGTVAAIGLGLAGVGSALGASSSKKAAKTAANTEMQVAQQNNALARDIYGQNRAALSPYMARGNAAGDTINALLGIGGTQGYGSPTGMSPQQAQGYNAQNPLQYQIRNALLDAYAAPESTGAAMPPQTGFGGQTAQQAADNAFDIFRNSTGYQFRLGEGANALNSLYAGAGTLQSGAAAKALQDYGQNMASQEFGNYLGYLGNQQGVGLSGASALAGVGQNYANSVMANNSNAGSAAANAALVKGANNPFANTLSILGGGLFGMAR